MSDSDKDRVHRICSCGQGYSSAYDGKCGHCRSTKEQKTYVWKHANNKFKEKTND